MLTEMIVVEDSQRVRAGIRVENAYRVWAKEGLNAIVAYARDRGFYESERILAFCVDGLSVERLSVVRLLDDDLLLSGGDKLYITQPICVVTQPKLPF